MDTYLVSSSAIEALNQENESAKLAKISRSENPLRLTLEISEMVKNKWRLLCGSILVFPPFNLKWATIL